MSRSRPHATRTVTGLVLAALMTVAIGGAASAGGRVVVDVADNSYAPDLIRVRPGDVLVFTNSGKQLHSLTLIGHENRLDQVFLKPGQTFELTVSFPPGQYELGCNIHMHMRGQIVVEPA